MLVRPPLSVVEDRWNPSDLKQRSARTSMDFSISVETRFEKGQAILSCVSSNVPERESDVMSVESDLMSAVSAVVSHASSTIDLKQKVFNRLLINFTSMEDESDLQVDERRRLAV